jgi:transcription elongation GreA/GreB family factor
VDKAILLQTIVNELIAELALQTDAANTAREEATDAESRSEDKHDMRGQTAAYLAAGQAKMAAEIGEAIKAFRNLALHAFGVGEPAAIGALVTLKERGRRSAYFVGPARGGLEVKVDDMEVMVVTPASPLGRALMGHCVGERVMLPQGQRTVEHTIVSVE